MIVEVAQVKVAVVKENARGERRVALVPDSIHRLAQIRLDVLVEQGAGAAPFFPDHAYAEAGPSIVSHEELFDKGDILLLVGAPAAADIARLAPGQAVIGMLSPLTQPELARKLGAAGGTPTRLAGTPRTPPAPPTMAPP